MTFDVWYSYIRHVTRGRSKKEEDWPSRSSGYIMQASSGSLGWVLKSHHWQLLYFSTSMQLHKLANPSPNLSWTEYVNRNGTVCHDTTWWVRLSGIRRDGRESKTFQHIVWIGIRNISDKLDILCKMDDKHPQMKTYPTKRHMSKQRDTNVHLLHYFDPQVQVELRGFGSITA